MNALDIRVIYENKDFVALNKPAGLLVHSSGKSPYSSAGGRAAKAAEPTLVDWLSEHYPQTKGVGDDPVTRPGIVHRLDKDTSGVIIVALSDRAYDFLKRSFQSHEVKKTYIALVYGRVSGEKGLIDAPLGLKPGTTKRTTYVRGAKMVKEARTLYEVDSRYGFQGSEFTLLKIKPETGRTHQIRAHLASINHPVVGDVLYGKSKMKDRIAEMIGIGRQFLHAETISLTAPSGERLTISAGLPEDLSRALNLLSRGSAVH